MTTERTARALMIRHHQMIKNRQQSMLNRAANEMGVEVDPEYSGKVQGKLDADFCQTYDRSNASLS